MRKLSLCTPRRQALAAAVLLAVAAPALAASPSLWQRVRADPRAAYVATTTPDERFAFARDYGLENLLPRPDATTRTVANCNDSGSGSLRAAVAASASGDIVDASGLACSTISLTTGAIDIGVDSLTIKGPGPDALKVGNGSKYYHRVFNHMGAGTLTISGMTVTKGTIRTGGTDPGSTGGCINSAGKVSLGNWLDPANRAQGVVVSDCAAISTQSGIQPMGGGVYARYGMFLYASVISGCSAIAQSDGLDAFGGGVALPSAETSAGIDLTIKYSEVRDNKVRIGTSVSANSRGGGIWTGGKARVSITNTTIAGNDAGDHGVGGGAFFNVPGADEGGTMEIRDSTISSNIANTGSGLYIDAAWGSSDGNVHVSSTTITGNHSHVSGSGVTISGGAINLQSTIISGNAVDEQSDLFIGGANAGGANNLIGVIAFDTGGLPPPAIGMITSTNPGLAPLANNGGLTRTHALLPNSPAIDHGNNSADDDYDQRGIGHPRVIGAAADIGAFERDPDVIFYNGFE